MVLHGWVRGRIPFFIPPPRIEGPQLEEDKAAPVTAAGPETTAEGQPETEEQKACQVAAVAIAEVLQKAKGKKGSCEGEFI